MGEGVGPRAAPREAIARAEALIAQHPDWSGRGEVLLWIAGQHTRAGRLREAQTVYERAAREAVHEGDRFAAVLGAGEVAMLSGDLDAAERLIRELDPGADQGRASLRTDGLTRAAVARGRQHLLWSAIAMLAASLGTLIVSLRIGAGSWRAALHAAARPPTEALFLFPIAALLATAAHTTFSEIGPTVAWISAGGIAVTWISGAGLGARRRRPRVIALHVASAAAAIVAICYIAVHRSGLYDLIAQTVQLGPD
jgi:hypothetical protein